MKEDKTKHDDGSGGTPDILGVSSRAMYFNQLIGRTGIVGAIQYSDCSCPS